MLYTCCTRVVVLWVCCVERSSEKGKRVRPPTLSDELKLEERFAGRKIGPKSLGFAKKNRGRCGPVLRLMANSTLRCLYQENK